MTLEQSSISHASSSETRFRVLVITEESATQTSSGKVLPAENLYKGSFLEVRRFLDELRGGGEAKLLILSSSKGAVSGQDMLTKYTVAPVSPSPPPNVAEALARAIRNASDEGMAVIVALSYTYLRWIIQPPKGIGHFASLMNARVAVVTGGRARGRLAEFARIRRCRWLVLPRVGVTRLGRKNRQAILRWLFDENESLVVAGSPFESQIEAGEGG